MKLFSRILSQIQTAVRQGGSDPGSNPQLAQLLEKAKEVSIPKDKLESVLKKDKTGGGAEFEEIVYEGHGPSGVALIVETLTDNRKRTAPVMREVFSDFGGKLGNKGSVSRLFKPNGLLVVANVATGAPFDRLMDAAIESGAEDVRPLSDNRAEVLTEPTGLAQVKRQLEAAGFVVESTSFVHRPLAVVSLTKDDYARLTRMLERLEDNPDVQQVFHNGVLQEQEETT